MQLAQPLRGKDLLGAEALCVPWLWEGLVADGNVSMLTGLWKSGKTTLLSMLLSKRHRGGILLHRVVRPGGTAIVSEEPADLWRRRARQYDFGPNISLFCRPFAGVPSAPDWQALLEQLVREHVEHGVDLVVFDPLMAFLPCGESDSSALRRLLPTLRLLTERGIAVLLFHHPAKDEGGLGKAARGSGVLSMSADIVLELRLPQGNTGSYRRRLFGFSRYPETPRDLVIEMNPRGDDYTVLSDEDVHDDFCSVWETIGTILLAAQQPLTRQEILSRWPADRAKPHDATLWRWLIRARGLGLVVREGAGTKTEPLRYRLIGAAEATEEPSGE